MKKFFVFEQFPVFVFTSSKKAVKINANKLYSGSINAFERAKVKKEIDTYLSSFLTRQKKPLNASKLNFILYAPESLGAVKLSHWMNSFVNFDDIKYVKWDLTNYAFFWQKSIEDALVSYGYLRDDDIKNIKYVSWKYIPSKWKDRRIVLRVR